MRKGKLLYNSLIRSVLRVPFERRESGHIGRDGAFFGSSGNYGLSVNTTVYGGAGAEQLAFYRAFNGALAAGLEPEGVCLSLLFPLSCTEAGIRRSMECFQEAAVLEGVAISGGHTAASGAVSAPVFTVTVSGERAVPAPELSGDTEGLSLIFTKRAGDAGAEIIAREKRELLLKRFSGGFLDEVPDGLSPAALSCRPEAEILRHFGGILHDVSEGGLYGALYELAEGFRTGFRADLHAVPLRQRTVEICNFLGGDPFALLSTGCLLAAVPDGQGALKALSEAGVEAAEIGCLRGGRDKIIRRGREEGFLPRPGADFIMELEEFG